MTYVHPNLSEHYGDSPAVRELSLRLNDAVDHLALAAALYDAAALPPVELRRVLRSLARREGAAAPGLAHELAAQRLRALLRLDAETARVMARAYADAFIDLPAEWAARSRELEFSVIKNALHLREFQALTQILPWLRGEESAQWFLSRLEAEEDAAAEPAFALA